MIVKSIVRHEQWDHVWVIVKSIVRHEQWTYFLGPLQWQNTTQTLKSLLLGFASMHQYFAHIVSFLIRIWGSETIILRFHTCSCCSYSLELKSNIVYCQLNKRHSLITLTTFITSIISHMEEPHKFILATLSLLTKSLYITSVLWCIILFQIFEICALFPSILGTSSQLWWCFLGNTKMAKEGIIYC